MNNIAILNKHAVNYLSKYNTSKKNLERILRNKIRRMKIEKKEKFFLYKSITSIITKLEFNKFINDNSYADSKIYFLSLQGKSKNYIKNYLMQKGIEKNIIVEELNKYELNNPNWEIESAKIFIRKKKLGLKNINDLVKMARAGFDYRISKKILEID